MRHQRTYQSQNEASARNGRISFFQPRLFINQPNDPYEQEADAVANKVTGMPDSMTSQAGFFKPAVSLIHRKCEHCAAEEKNILRKELNKGEADGPGYMENYVDRLPNNGQHLPGELRNYFEPRFGYDFSGVKIHTDSVAAKSAQSINALAYTTGNHIVFNDGQYSPGTDDGKKLLGHELTHVIQQQSAGSSAIQRMAACPAHLNDNDPVPPGWRLYPGPTSVFHCGFRTILENRAPTRDDPMNECVYDHSGVLVDDTHSYAGCRGTPDQYNSSAGPLDWVLHGTIDSGGVVRQGVPAFITSRVYDISIAISSAVTAIAAGAQTLRGLSNVIGTALITLVITGQAICDPTNWIYHSSVPMRTRRHLNVIGGLLSSISLSGNPDNLLRNLTKPLRDYPIANLLTEISSDMNMAMQSGGDPTTISAGEIGSMSLFQFVEWLRSRSFISFMRPPEQIAQETLQTQASAQP